MTIQRDENGIAHVSGCWIWRIIRITRDVGLRVDWHKAIRADYPHLTDDDIHEALAYARENRGEIEALIQQSYEDDGTATKHRDRRAKRQQETLKGLDIVQEALYQMKMDGAEPGAIYLAHPAKWYLTPYNIAQALSKEFEVDGPDELFGVPIVRAGERSFIISESRYNRCISLDLPLKDPRTLLDD